MSLSNVKYELGYGLIFEPEKALLLYKEVKLNLEPAECRFINCLIGKLGTPVSIEELLNSIFDSKFEEREDQSVYNLVSQLRKRMSELSGDQEAKEIIKQRRKLGYYMEYALPLVESSEVGSKLLLLAEKLEKLHNGQMDDLIGLVVNLAEKQRLIEDFEALEGIAELFEEIGDPKVIAQILKKHSDSGNK